MTTTSNVFRNSYPGDNVRIVFPFEFKIFSNSQVEVRRVSAEGTVTIDVLGVDYVVAISESGDGGTITYNTIVPTDEETVVLNINMPFTQETVYEESTKFPSISHETALDKLTMISLQLKESLSRTLSFIRGDTAIGTTIPTIDERKNKVLAFGEDGSPTATTSIGTSKGEWAAATEYGARDIVRIMTEGVYQYNLFFCIVAHTSSADFGTDFTAGKWSLLFDNQEYIEAAIEAAVDEVEADVLAIIEPEIASIASHLLPVGSISPYAGEEASLVGTPFMVCNGATLSRATYAALFAVIGTTYGAPSGDTFSLPNLYKRFPIGFDGSPTYSMGHTGGEETVTLSKANIPPHTHRMPVHTRNDRESGGSDMTRACPFAEGQDTFDGSEGGLAGTAHNNMPPYLVVRYIIKYTNA